MLLVASVIVVIAYFLLFTFFFIYLVGVHLARNTLSLFNVCAMPPTFSITNHLAHFLALFLYYFLLGFVSVLFLFSLVFYQFVCQSYYGLSFTRFRNKTQRIYKKHKFFLELSIFVKKNSRLKLWWSISVKGLVYICVVNKWRKKTGQRAEQKPNIIN